MRMIGWEEAFYVRRIIQRLLYNSVYEKPDYWDFLTRTEIRDEILYVNPKKKGEKNAEREKWEKNILFSKMLIPTNRIMRLARI